jgi:hypothetical protein
MLPPLDEFPRNGNLKRIGLKHIRIKEDGGLLIPIASNPYLNEKMHQNAVYSLSNFRYFNLGLEPTSEFLFLLLGSCCSVTICLGEFTVNRLSVKRTHYSMSSPMISLR